MSSGCDLCWDIWRQPVPQRKPLRPRSHGTCYKTQEANLISLSAVGTKHLGTRNKCLTAPAEAPLQRGERQVHAGWMQKALRWECCNLCSAFAWSPCFCIPIWSRCNKQSFAEARSQCPWGSTPFLLGLGERACELLCALACHLAVICVGTSGASQFLSASLGGREVRGRAAKHKKQTSSHLCTCTKHLGTRSKCFMLLD